MLTKDELLNTKPSKPVPLELPEWGTVYIKRWNGLDLQQWQTVARQMLDDKGSPAYPATFSAKLLQLSVCDETGKLVFTTEDVGKLTELPASILAEVFAASSRLNKLGDDQLEAAKSFFSKIQSKATGTK